MMICYDEKKKLKDRYWKRKLKDKIKYRKLK
jgi:hypothetical protein